MRTLEIIREIFAELGKWLLRYANIRSDNRIERMDKKAVLYEAKVKAQAEAYASKQAAKSKRDTNKKWARAKMWGDVLKYYRRTRSKIELWRRLKLRRKAILQRAKAKKWQAVGFAVNRFFAALRHQLRLTIRWFRRIHIAHPGLLRRLANRVTRKFSFLLAFVFLALTILGIMDGIQWIQALAPVGIVWSLALPLIIKKSYFARLGQVLVFIPSSLWVCVWFIIRFRST